MYTNIKKTHLIVAIMRHSKKIEISFWPHAVNTA